MADNIVLQLRNISKQFSTSSKQAIKVLDNINLDLAAGEIVGLMAPSGSGKTTLLQICGLIESPTSGEIFLSRLIYSHQRYQADDKTLAALRGQYLGFVFQNHRLLPELSARENVALPLMLQGQSQAQALPQADEILSMLGLQQRLSHYPGMLSGGEQQRVAVARAFIHKPRLIIADEPTGNLDVDSGEQVFYQLQQLSRQLKIAALVATHNPSLTKYMDRVLVLNNHHLINHPSFLSHEV